MKIYFQWELWAYSHIASIIASWELKINKTEIIWVSNFEKVWENIWDNWIWVLPIENSYAGSVHENMYKFLRFPYKVIWEIYLPIRHCLLSIWKDIKKIKKVYSHPQALSQCYEFLKKHNIEPISYFDTAWSAKMISESRDEATWAIASIEAWEIYNLNILEQDIQDQNGNTTRFFIVAPKNTKLDYPTKNNKTTVLFEARNIPASLYKCLWAFATNKINLSKIESMPNHKDPFSYIFWLDFEWTSSQEEVKEALHELSFFTKEYMIIGEY